MLRMLLSLKHLSGCSPACSLGMASSHVQHTFTLTPKKAWVDSRSICTQSSALSPAKPKISEPGPDPVAPFLATHKLTPAVEWAHGLETAPTALSWLRRMGPAVHHGFLHSAFRYKQVKVFDGQRVRRVSEKRVLKAGDVILYPLSLLDAGSKPGAAGGASAAGRREAKEVQGGRKVSPASQSLTRASSSREVPAPAGTPAPPPPPSQGAAALGRPPATDSHNSNVLSNSSAEALVSEAMQGGSASAHPPCTPTSIHPAESASRSSRGELHSAEHPASNEHHAQPARAQEGVAVPQPQLNQDSPVATAAVTAAVTADVPGMVDPRSMTPGMVRSWVLSVTKHCIFINKPAGIPVHGHRSLDSHMRTALRLHPEDTPKLVHRLDRNVSGVMVVGRNTVAAAWLSAAFRLKSGGQAAADLHAPLDSKARRAGKYEEAITPESDVRPDLNMDGVGVRRVYWALLAGSLPPRREGRIRYPMLVDGKFLPAVTYYRVRHTTPAGLTWVELEPVTGRRHQLRVHCAHVLNAPIVGDVRYGYKGLTPTKGLVQALSPDWWTAYSPQTAHDVLSPPTRKDRRRAAAAAAEKLRMQKLGLQHPLEEMSSDDDDGADGDEEDGVEEGRAGRKGSVLAGEGDAGKAGKAEAIMPLFLHARRITLRRSADDAVAKVKAPLPVYMQATIEAMRWPLPSEN